MLLSRLTTRAKHDNQQVKESRKLCLVVTDEKRLTILNIAHRVGTTWGGTIFVLFDGLRCVLWSKSRGALNLKSQNPKKSGKSRGASNLKKWISRYYAYLNDFLGKKSWSSRFEKLFHQFWTLKSMGASDLKRVPICKNVHVVRPQTLGALVFDGRILDKSRGAVNLKSEKT